MAAITYLEAVRSALADALRDDERVFLLGRDTHRCRPGRRGWVIIGGKLHKVPPRGPLVQLLEVLSEDDVLETADLKAIQKAVKKIGD